LLLELVCTLVLAIEGAAIAGAGLNLVQAIESVVMAGASLYLRASQVGGTRSARWQLKRVGDLLNALWWWK
jgi:hypothetical protein